MMNRQRGFGLIAYLIGAGVLVAALAGAWFAIDRNCWTTACQNAEAERDKALAEAANWRDVAAEQSAAVDEWKRKAVARARDAAVARKDAEALAQMHKDREAMLLAAKPTVEGDPCASACVLLRQPL
jgi:hypothetical protein